jgi:MarR family transcriptional regulator, negative regulator of the multidrug operon emrRAB
MCVRYAHIVKLKNMRGAHIHRPVIDRAANLLGVVGLAIADRIEEAARDILSHAGETPAAVVVIGYGLGPSNDQLRRILGLSHPGSVRLVDRLVADGLVERRKGQDKRSIALYLTAEGDALREELLKGRLAAIRPLLLPLTSAEQETLTSLLHKILSYMPTTDLERCHLCRLCDDRVCRDCPIPAAFRSQPTAPSPSGEGGSAQSAETGGEGGNRPNAG